MTAKNILITRRIPEIGIKKLLEKGYVVDIGGSSDPISQKDLIKLLKKKPYDGVISLLTDKIDGVVFNSAPSVKIFANYAVGFDNFDVNEAKQRGVMLTNTPGGSSDCVAEHAMALILGLTTRMVEADAYVRKGKYKGWSPMNFIGTDLKDKKVGLLGAGRIGERVAYMANKGFGASILYYDVKKNPQIENDCGAMYFSTAEELLRNADIVSIHLPLLDSTKHFINEDRLKMMKPTSFLINTSRGPVVDENALVKALKNKVIAGAGLDVFEFEPKLASGLSKLSNVVLTPHIASARESARNDMSIVAVKNIIDFFETGKAANPVYQ